MACSPAGAGLLLSTPSTTTTITTPPNPNKFQFCSPPLTSTRRKLAHHNSSTTAKCVSKSSITEFDLYDLLGIDTSSDQSQIKMAYRSLQKRCHPDIAGPNGHDMAIILNDAYSILSDPSSRAAYDKVQSKFTEFKGYTGKPLYSTWLGPENEERAVFVDEIRCVGCLKCALFAKNTFAIESSYGRARVVAQWADPEDKIFDAIQTCPVDCISMVERSNLAALEFLMSKQPRGTVRMSSGNAVGARVSNIFVDVKKFQSRFHEVKSKASNVFFLNDIVIATQESDLLREARISAIHAIRSISNLWYWQTPQGGAATQEPRQNLLLIAENSSLPQTNKLREAAVARQQATYNKMEPEKRMSSDDINQDEYWTPEKLVLPPPPPQNSHDSKRVLNSAPRTNVKKKVSNDKMKCEMVQDNQTKPLRSIFPIGSAMVAALIIRFQGVEMSVSGGSLIRDHAAGSLAAEIVNSSWLQTILAGVTWYVIGLLVVELADILRRGKR